MKLYKTTAIDDGKTWVCWSGSQADAASHRKHCVSNEGYKRANVETVTVEVPTDKAGLLAFLNSSV